MKSSNVFTVQALWRRQAYGVLITGVLLVATQLSSPAATFELCNPCTRTAQDIFMSCHLGAADAYWRSRAVCNNLPTPEEERACRAEAQKDMQSEIGECKKQLSARLEICRSLGGDAYYPAINPADFVTTIDNPYFPLPPGTTYVYEGETEKGIEHIEVSVTSETKVIMGVTCIVVRDTVTADGQLLEDTLDWYAQDKEGNVWYFGENSLEYENGEIVSLEGSWKAGADGAQPGIVMEAHPKVGDVYRQEFDPGEAEDMAEVLSLTESAAVPFGSFSNCLMTKDFSGLEPDAIEHKHYAEGVGFIQSIDLETGEGVKLIDISTK